MYEDKKNAAEARLKNELAYFVNEIPAADASDALVHLLMHNPQKDDMSTEMHKALHAALFLINAISRVQLAEQIHADI